MKLRRYRPLWGASVLLVSGMMLWGCGRTSTAGLNGDGSITPPSDTLLVDQVIYPERWFPTEGGPPPPPPPPPTDGGPPPPPPPPLDFGPPPDMPIYPDTGTCSPSCQQLCQLLKKCGIISGGVGQCTQQCAGWPSSQFSCLKAQYCATGQSCSAVKACIPVPPQQPDLVISSFTAKVSGSTVTYTAQACNNGKGVSSNFYVDVYYDRSTAPGVQQFGNQYKSYNSLAAGACVTATFTRSNAPAGTYTSWAQADADGAVAETDTTPPPPPLAPDLQITNTQINLYGSFSVTVRYRFTICNKGNLASGSTQVHVYYNLSAAPKQGQSGDKYTTVPGLQPAACTTRTIYRSGTPQGSYSSYGQVDPQNLVKESNETNNVYGPVKVNVGSTPGSDLQIDSFSTTIYGTSTVRYRIRVCNKGTGTSGTTAVHVYYNRSTAPPQGQSGDQSTSVPMLSPGACSNRNIYRSGTPSGTYTSWAQVDPQNSVTEVNESNNTAGPLKVTVGGTTTQADLHFSQFSAKVAQTSSGTYQVVYSAVACNKGTAAASFFRVDIYYNRSSAPKTGQSGNTYATIPYLGAGSCTTVNRTRNNAPAGSYTSWAQVDTSGAVSESSETNNVAGPVTVTVGSASSCSTICSFAISCGVFQAAQTAQCLSWCNGLSTSAKQCVSTATTKGSCTDFKNCNTPPPPPPPPPPTVCPDLCNYLINTCKILPSNQYWTCVGACNGLTPAKIKCAQDAKAKSQCMQVLLCLY